MFQDGYRDVFGEDMKLGESLIPVKLKDFEEFVESLVAQKVDKE